MLPQNKNNPCLHCVPPKRHLGCHGICKEYKESIDEYHAKQNLIKEKKAADRAFREYEQQAYERITK